MKQDFEGAGEELKGECTFEHIEEPSGGISLMQTESTLAVSVVPDPNQSQLPNVQTESTLAVGVVPDPNQSPLPNLLGEVPDDALGRCRLECSSHADTGKGRVPNQSMEGLEITSSSNHGSENQSGVSQDLELDKTLPPIKTRREGDSREHSPSDLTPPSPKRLRQGSRGTQEKWNGLWNMEGNL